MLTRTLLKWNYGVQAVVDFGRVGEQFAQFSPTWLLLDISLPFSTAITGARKSERQAKVSPVIFISSAADDMNLVMAVNIGERMISWQKPFRLEVVLAKIQALLRRAYTFGTRKDVIHAGEATLSLSGRHACP